MFLGNIGSIACPFGRRITIRNTYCAQLWLRRNYGHSVMDWKKCFSPSITLVFE